MAAAALVALGLFAVAATASWGASGAQGPRPTTRRTVVLASTALALAIPSQISSTSVQLIGGLAPCLVVVVVIRVAHAGPSRTLRRLAATGLDASLLVALWLSIAGLLPRGFPSGGTSCWQWNAPCSDAAWMVGAFASVAIGWGWTVLLVLCLAWEIRRARRCPHRSGARAGVAPDEAATASSTASAAPSVSPST